MVVSALPSHRAVAEPASAASAVDADAVVVAAASMPDAADSESAGASPVAADQVSGFAVAGDTLGQLVDGRGGLEEDMDVQ